jgi:hypothetical protein
VTKGRVQEGSELSQEAPKTIPDEHLFDKNERKENAGHRIEAQTLRQPVTAFRI